jgi:hypothetical protein
MVNGFQEALYMPALSAVRHAQSPLPCKSILLTMAFALPLAIKKSKNRRSQQLYRPEKRIAWGEHSEPQRNPPDDHAECWGSQVHPNL